MVMLSAKRLHTTDVQIDRRIVESSATCHEGFKMDQSWQGGGRQANEARRHVGPWSDGGGHVLVSGGRILT